MLPESGRKADSSGKFLTIQGVCFHFAGVAGSSTPPQLVMGEYCTTDATHTVNGRVGTLPIDDTDGLLQATGGTVTALSAYALPQHQTQGAARYQGHWYFDESHGYSDAGLWRATAASDGTLTLTGGEIRTAVGAEDLYVEHGQATGNPPLLWSLSEHRSDTDNSSCAATDPTPCGRVVYAHRIGDILAQP